MNRLYAVPAVLLCIVVSISANGFSDSVAAFTGARTILVWTQETWCNADYSVKAGCSGGSDLMVLDTKEGVPRSLTQIPAGAGEAAWILYLRISRSGRWATYNQGAKSYIVDLATPGATPKVFLDKANCTFWCARAMWVDQSTGTEYSYCLDNYVGGGSGSAIVRVPFNSSTGVADVSKATTIKQNGGARVDDAFAVSEDGKKIGGAFPWPTTAILDVATGRLDIRHNGMFGCQANLSPDNSYRLHHCEDDHLGVIMFDPYPSEKNWFVNMSVNLVGIPNNSYVMDFGNVRWSNHTRFLMANSPICDNSECYEGAECSFSPAQVKAAKQYMLGHSYLLKWNSTYTQIETSMYIPGADVRVKSSGGDAWISTGVVAPGTGTRIASGQQAMMRPSDLRIEHTAGSIAITSRTPVRIAIADVRGRTVRQTVGAGCVRLGYNDLAPGLYRVMATSHEGSVSRELTIFAH